jgi:ribosome-binding factor A
MPRRDQPTPDPADQPEGSTSPWAKRPASADEPASAGPPPIHGKIASSIQRAIQSILTRGLQDPRLDGVMVTVTEVDLAQDGRDATIHVSILPEKAERKAVAAVQHAASFIRREAGDLIRIRALPQFHFVLDRRLKNQAAVIRALGTDAAARQNPPDNVAGQATNPNHPSES